MNPLPGAIRIPAPVAGADLILAAAIQMQLDFDPDSAGFERKGNDLVITGDNGGTVTVLDFFIVNGQPLPGFSPVESLVAPAGDYAPSVATVRYLFAFSRDGMHAGTDIILDFFTGEDRLDFSDLFGGVSLDVFLDGRVSGLNLDADGTLGFFLSGGRGTNKEVLIRFDRNDRTHREFVAAYAKSPDEKTRQRMLRGLIRSIAGG